MSGTSNVSASNGSCSQGSGGSQASSNHVWWISVGSGAADAPVQLRAAPSVLAARLVLAVEEGTAAYAADVKAAISSVKKHAGPEGGHGYISAAQSAALDAQAGTTPGWEWRGGPHGGANLLTARRFHPSSTVKPLRAQAEAEAGSAKRLLNVKV